MPIYVAEAEYVIRIPCYSYFEASDETDARQKSLQLSVTSWTMETALERTEVEINDINLQESNWPKKSREINCFFGAPLRKK